MTSSLLYDRDGLRTFAVVCETGDEAMLTLKTFAATAHLRASHFTAIGAFSRAVVAYFDWESKTYQHRPLDEQVEVLSLVGDVTIDRDTRVVHAHAVLGKSDATAHGGHLIEGFVRPTLEIVITEMPTYLRRRHDRESGLALIDASKVASERVQESEGRRRGGT